MATIAGTVDEVNLLQGEGTGPGARKTYALSCSFAAMTAGDDATVGAKAAIEAATKNGKTFTVRRGSPGNPGTDASAAAAYAGLVVTNAAGTLTITVGDAAGATAAKGAMSGVQVIVVGDES